MRRLQDGGGGLRAVSWVIAGMNERTMLEGRPDRDALRRQLAGQGLPLDIVENMICAAEAAGGFAADRPLVLPQGIAEEVENQAITIALATFESRLRVRDLLAQADPASHPATLYRDRYPVAIEQAGLDRVEFIDRFPVLTGHFGYTRGNPAPGESRLRAFREADGTYSVYGDIAETEALFFRLAPQRVAQWLRAKGHQLNDWNSPETASAAILQASANLAVTTDVDKLTHSFAHRLIRLAAVHAGIERNALSELLVSRHLGFFDGTPRLAERTLAARLSDVGGASRYSGMLPCFLGGRVARLVRSMRSAWVT